MQISIIEGIIAENILAKAEIARFEQFHLLSQYFQKYSAAEASESVYMWERVNSDARQRFNNNLTALPFIKQRHSCNFGKL